MHASILSETNEIIEPFNGIINPLNKMIEPLDGILNQFAFARQLIHSTDEII